MHELNRQDQPPKPGPAMPIVRLRADQKLTCTVISKALWGIWTHWAGQRSEPCFAEKKHCGGCKKGLPKRWKGYLHVYDHTNRQECFIEFTPVAADALLSQLGKGESLRRNRIQLERGRGNKARLKVILLTAASAEMRLPDPQDPYQVFCKLWGIDEQLGREESRSSVPISEAI